MAISKAEIAAVCKVSDTPDLGVDGVTNPTLVYQLGTSTKQTLTSTTTVPATMQWQDERTLSSGSDEPDMTALTDGNLGTAKDLTGLKIQVVKVIANSANTDKVQVTDGNSNGYNIFGHALGSVALPAGGMVMFFGNDALDDVASGDKTWRATSGDADAKYYIQLIAG